MLKKLFAALASNPWKTFAASIGATYEDGGFAQSERIWVDRENHLIVITVGTNQRGNKGYRYTRFRCSYTSSTPCYFSIRPKRSLFGRSRKSSVNIKELYDFHSSNEAIVAMLTEDEGFCKHLQTVSAFKYLSEKDDGEWGPAFLPTEHQLCLELEDEVEDPERLSAGIGIILATLNLYRINGWLNDEKTTVSYK